MKRILLVLLALAPLAAQETPKPAAAKEQTDERNWERRLFKLQYADAAQVEQILRTFGVPIVANREFRTVAVRAPKEVMPAMEDAIKKLDVAPPAVKNVDLTFYLMAASKQPGGNLPADLQPVAKQVASVMAYQGFDLLDTAIVRTRAGREAIVGGVLESAKMQSYSIQARTVDVSAGSGGRNAIHIQYLRVSIGGGGRSSSIETSIDFAEGQKVVIGKTALEGSDRALIVVVTAKVTD